MKKINKNNTFPWWYFILAAVFLWCAVTSTIQRFKCVKMSETELLLAIPTSFVLDFKKC